MRRSLILGVSLTLVLILLIGLIGAQDYQFEGKKSLDDIKEKETEIKKSTINRIVGFFKRLVGYEELFNALESGDIKSCDKLIFEELKSECQQELVYTISDPKECEGLGDPKKNKFYARNNCYENIALKTDDESLCNLIGPSEKECEDFRKYAKKYADEEELENIEEIIAQCKEQGTLNKNYCFAEIAVKRKDVNVCDVSIIKKEGYPDYTPFCYDRVAKVKGDITLCKNIDCVGTVAINTQNPDLCKEIDNEKYSIKSEESALSWSDKLVNKGLLDRDEEQDKCFLGISTLSDFTDIKICSEIKSNNIITDCVMNIVQRTSDIHNCEYIPATIKVDDHYLFSLGEVVDVEVFSQGVKKLVLVPGMFLLPDSIKDVQKQPSKNAEYDEWKITTDDPNEWWMIQYLFNSKKVSFFGPLGPSKTPYSSSYLNAKMTTESPYVIDIYFQGSFLEGCESITILEDGSKQLKNCPMPNLFSDDEHTRLDCYTLVSVGHKADINCRNALEQSAYDNIMGNMTAEMRKEIYGNRELISKNQCISNIKENMKGAEECLKINKEKHRNECLYRSAKEISSEEPCRLIKIDGQQKNSCKEYALYLIENYGNYAASAEYRVTAGLISEQDALSEDVLTE